MDRRTFGAGLLALGAAAGAPRPATLTVAAAQMSSVEGDIAGNLARADTLADEAARRGARLILFPEFMPTGYALNESAWSAAEPADGPTARWLRATGRRLQAWIGTSFLEAEGADFFNTFALAGPDGRIAGRVRKQTPAGLEAYLFRGGEGPRVIETPLGRIGVAICYESYLCATVAAFARERPDLILLPHSYPDMSKTGGIPAPPGTHVAGWHASRAGAPVVMVNKVGPWSTRSPFGPVAGVFPGRSAIVDRDGKVLADLGDEPAVGVATVRPGAAPARGEVDCRGPLVAALAPSASLQPDALAAAGARAYADNPRRAAAALRASASPAG